MDGQETHKTMLLSSAYQMASTGSEAGLKADRATRTTGGSDASARGRGSPRFDAPGRRVAERNHVRPSVYPKIPKDVLAGQSVPGQGWPTMTGPEANRRSVYVHVKRSLLVPVLNNHDAADTDLSCPVRYTTTVPTQALGMLNGEFANEQAAALAKRLQKDCPMIWRSRSPGRFA